MSGAEKPGLPPKIASLAIWSLILSLLGLLCCCPLCGIPGVICGHLARARIKRSMGSAVGNDIAIAGLVLGYGGIIVAAFLIPLFIIPTLTHAKEKAQRIACVDNLQNIAIAKQKWAAQKDKQPTDTPTPADLMPYLGTLPICPEDPGHTFATSYNINPLNTLPTCKLDLHHRVPH